MNMSTTKTLSWAAKKLRPASVNITPKALNISADKSTPNYWFYDSPFLTQFFSSFSATFPGGEQYMIDTVRLFRDQVKDHKVLYKDCGGFIGQEAHHSREHKVINDFMQSRGFPVESVENMIDRILPFFKKMRKKDQMALTAAAEHYTAYFGDLVLSNPEVIENVHPTIRPLFVWHAIEEIEHKAVTYDLFDATDGEYLSRIYGFVLASALLGYLTTYGMATSMWVDRKNMSVRDTAKGLWWMFGFGKNSGYLIKSLPFLLEYFQPDFHPWDDDNSHLISKWRSELDKINVGKEKEHKAV